MQTESIGARPLREIIRNIAVAIAESQTELDRSALAIQREIERDLQEGELPYELDVPSYRFSEVDVDIKLSLSLQGKGEVDNQGEVRAYRPILTAYPINPRNTTQTEYKTEAATDVKLSIVPVPRELPRS